MKPETEAVSDEAIARAWFDADYGAIHDRAPGYVYAFLRRLALAGEHVVQPQAAAEPAEVDMVTYTQAGATWRYRQRKCDPLPLWAIDVQVEENK